MINKFIIINDQLIPLLYNEILHVKDETNLFGLFSNQFNNLFCFSKLMDLCGVGEPTRKGSLALGKQAETV